MADAIENDDYKVISNKLKDEANIAFQKGDIEKSIELYTQAINIDPDNHILYSNRSAAYMKVDSKSKSLRDAERCVELEPSFIKGYNRLGVAQQSLKRYDAAVQSFKMGIKLDPNNTLLWSLLNSCQEVQNRDKQLKFADAAKERQLEEDRLKKLADQKESARLQLEQDQLSNFLNDIDNVATTSTTAPAASVTSENEGDLLSGFFSEITNHQAKISNAKELLFQSAKIGSKYATQDLGDAESQFNRITQKNFEWRNLNPFYVMQLGIDATDEDVKQRYKNLSRMVHPDKLLNKENAREAFEQVKASYHKLQDEKQRNVVVMNIEYVRGELDKERRRLITKGLKENDLPEYDADLERRLIKHFAEIEMQRRRSETNLRFYNARDRIKEDEDKEIIRLEEEKENSWAEVERREKRVGEWRDFQEDPESKKVRIASWKEEHRSIGEKKHGQADVESWKKSWK